MTKIYAVTEKGNHNENEDRILINDVIIYCGSYETECDGSIKVCIADGVGGNNAGAVASNFVCESLRDIDIIKKESLVSINSQLISKSVENPNYDGMASTLSGVLLNESNASLFHIGNTRIYVCQVNYLKQITDDHTTVNWLLKNGKISKKDAEVYNKRNEITACFGGGNPSLINSLIFKECNEAIFNAKKIIITSDGVHEYVSIDEMEEFFNKEGTKPLVVCQEIINKAKVNGSEDDKSIIIIHK